MDEQQDQIAILQRPTADDRKEWKVYWEAQEMPWRTEPDIDEERQQYLAERRAVRPDIEKGIYPLRDENSSIKLTRADVEWLLATHESGGMLGPVDMNDKKQWKRQGLDLRGTDLRGVDLSRLPLACLRGEIPIMLGLSGDREFMRTAAEVHLEGADLRQIHLEKADLVGAHLERAWLGGAHLEGANLYEAHLDYTSLEEAHMEAASLAAASLRNAYLAGAHLEGASVAEANVQGADFTGSTGGYLAKAEEHGLDGGAHLEGAYLRAAHLENADLWCAHLEGANLSEAHLEGTILRAAHLGGGTLPPVVALRLRFYGDYDFIRSWEPANLRSAFLDRATQLNDIDMGTEKFGCALLADMNWGDANLAVVRWRQISTIGDERQAHRVTDPDGTSKNRATRLNEYEVAVRANRQLATALRTQGLNEDADRFAYKAQKLQRHVLWRQHRYGAAFGSWFLDMIAGYGYRPLRAFGAYALVIALFTALYLINAQFAAPHLTWDEALVLSISSFHGRGFFTSGISLGDTLARLAAGEAIIGLLIEITFIATFTQRFFAR